MLKQRADYLGNPLQGLPSSSIFLYFFLFFFIPELISAVTYPSAEFFFTDTRVMTQGCQRTSRISIVFFNYFTGLKNPQKMKSSLLLVSARRRDVASVAGLWFTDGLFFPFLFLFRSRSQPLLIRAPNFFLLTHVSCLRVVNAGLEFRLSF